MKKRIALILVAAAMLLTACGTTTSSGGTSSTDATSTDTSSEVVSTETTSEESSVDTASTESTATTESTASVASTTTTSKPSTVSTKSTATASTKTSSTKTSSTATPSGPFQGSMDSNPDVKRPSEITMVRTDFFGDSTDNVDEKTDWIAAMTARYGVKFNYIYPAKSDISTFLSTRVTSGELKGMIYLYSTQDVVKYMYDGLIQPLDDYLKNNKTWNSLPEAMRKIWVIDGKTWAVPNGYSFGSQWGTRYFRKDWSTKLGLTTPKTVDEVKDWVTTVGKSTVNGGPTQNLGITFAGLYTWYDLYAACGALTTSGDNYYVWQPDTNAFEDPYLTAGAKDVLELGRYFYQNNLTDPTGINAGFTDLRTKLSSGIVGSTHFYASQGKYTFGRQVYATKVRKEENRIITDPCSVSDWEKGTNIYDETNTITGVRSKNMFGVSPGGAPWVLMKGTPQAKETVNFFVDWMFSSEVGWYEAYRTTRDRFTLNNDGTVTLPYKNKATKTGYSAATAASFVEPTLYPAGTHVAFMEDANERSKATTTELTQYTANINSTSLAKGYLYNCLSEYRAVRSTTYNSVTGDYNNYVKALQVEAFTNKNSSVDKALAQYKKSMAAIGGNKILKEANDTFGLKNTYQSYN